MNTEDYLEFINGHMSKWYLPFCPFAIPSTTIVQNLTLIALIYKNALDLEEILKLTGHKLNEHALTAFREEIGRHYFDIMTFKASVEN